MRPNWAVDTARAWRRRILGMTGVSAAVHVVVLALIVVLAERGAARSLPLVAYTVEITDPSALGGRQPPGPVNGNLGGGPTRPTPAEPKGGSAPEPVAKLPPPPEPPKPKVVEPPPAPKPPEPVHAEPKKPEPEKTVALDKKPEPPKKPEPEKKPEPPKKVEPEKKVEPKPEAEKKPEVAKTEPPKKPEKTSEAEPGPAKPDATAKAEPGAKPADAKAKEPAGSASGSDKPDEYAALAERWRQQQGGGLGGKDTGSGPVGSGGGDGRGGGQLVGLEFLAYKQQVEGAVKTRWANVIARPGLVAVVRFEIGSDGAVSGIRVVQASGNSAYDASALRAVQLASPLPPPPARYVDQFREFQMEFHSEDQGGQGAG